MEVLIPDNFQIMKYQVLENMSGQMVKCMKVNGTRIRCMDKDYLFGEMENATRDNSPMTKEKVEEPSYGRMAASMRVIGKMGNNME
jgi:hypothetical protein